MFDAARSSAQVAIDSGGSSTNAAVPVAIPSAQLIAFTAASTLFVDTATQALLVLDANGKVGHVMALPRPRNTMHLAIGATYGSPPIVRADFDTRTVDTLTAFKALNPGAMTVTPDKDGNLVMKITVNPLDTGIDSIRPIMDKQLELQRSLLPQIPTPNGPRKQLPQCDFVPLSKMPAYEPPISPGSARADLDNNLWIVPRTVIGGGTGGLIYDVVNRQGEIVKRVRLPKGRALVGFGPDGVVYMANANEKTAFLERVRLR